MARCARLRQRDPCVNHCARPPGVPQYLDPGVRSNHHGVRSIHHLGCLQLELDYGRTLGLLGWSGALNTSFELWAHPSAFIFSTFEDQWRILAFESFKRLLRHVRSPITITPYNLLVCPESSESWNPGILGLSISCQSRNVTRQLGPDAVAYRPPCAHARSASPTRPALRQHLLGHG